MTFNAPEAFKLLSGQELNVTENVPLAKYNTYKTGGSARIMVRPACKNELARALKLINAHNWPYFLLGRGSNVLISDEGLNGIVICTKLFKGITCSKADCTVYANAGETLASVIKESGKVPLAGLEKLGGIPGSVGGSLIMNSGAYGVEIGDNVIYVDGINLDGSEFRLSKDECGFRYRHADGLNGKIVTGALFRLDPGSYDTFLESQAWAVANDRARKQPLHLPSCGSVFKNPPGQFSGEIIEKAGLKGYTIGEAQISEKHANFFLNLKKAKSNDLYKLIRHAQKVVKAKLGIELEPEVILIGKFYD